MTYSSKDMMRGRLYLDFKTNGLTDQVLMRDVLKVILGFTNLQGNQIKKYATMRLQATSNERIEL